MTPLEAKKSEPLRGGASFSLFNRTYRAVWSFSWAVLGKWTPVPMHSWRRLLLRSFGARIDRSAKIYPGTDIWYPPHLTMKPYACLARGVTCYNMAPILLECYALVSQRAHLCAGSHDIRDPNFQLTSKPITLGARAWIAAEAFVGPGVTVGEGAVVGARAVVTRDVEPWDIVVGNPATKVGIRKLRTANLTASMDHFPEAEKPI